jgi:competence protein ComFC
MLISLYKFKQERHLSPFIIQIMKDTYTELIEKPDYILPVPPSIVKLRKRGWDPVHGMAEGISSSSAPLLDILKKKEGREQKSLDFAGRMANIKGRFSLEGRLPAGAACLLVDDVFTTGATVSECARILKENGAGRVGALTLVLDP